VEDAAVAAVELARKWNTVVAVTGRIDLVTDGSGEAVSVHNGHPLMGGITGSGCAASALTGAFLAVGADDPLTAAASALITYGIAGEMGAEACSGPGSFRPALLDALSLVNPETVRRSCRAETDS
jgi:hydroxyethylthiazole kinase